MTPRTYRILTGAAEPLIRLYLRRRLATGREDQARFAERLGIAARARPDGALVWAHAASVGEANSVLPLIGRVLAARDDVHVLVTTGTITSAALLADRLPPRAFHQYVPVDRPRGVDSFLDHWRPDLALWTESEFWPNLIAATQSRGIPMVLVNARLSDRSFARWRRRPALIAPLLQGFTLCLGQSEGECHRLAALGARQARHLGNLKLDAPSLLADDSELVLMRAACAGRPTWLAASTHAGEEEAVARAHLTLRRHHPRLLTFVVPRHPRRGRDITGALSALGLSVARRGAGQPITASTDVYLADTMGELGLFYRLVEVVFVGGSLVPHGGQNPIEAARLGCALLHGPSMENFATMAAELRAADAAILVPAGDLLAAAAARLLDDDVGRAARITRAADWAAGKRGILDAVFAQIAPMIDALAAGRSKARPPSRDGHHARA